VAGNVRGMRDQTQDELTGYVHKAEATVSDHPWLSLAGGFGGGIALGLTSGGTNSQKPSAADHESASHGEGLLSRGVSALFSASGGPIFDEVRGTLQDTLSELKGTLQESVSDVVHGITGNSTAPHAAEHRQRVRDHVAV